MAVSVLCERLPLVQNGCQVMAAPLSEDCGLQVCRDAPACWIRRPILQALSVGLAFVLRLLIGSYVLVGLSYYRCGSFGSDRPTI